MDHSDVPVHQLSRTQLDEHLRFWAADTPDPVARLRRFAEQTIGQPYGGDPLGEGTYDAHDPRPLFALDRSDTRSFVEQTLAMAVAPDFATFFLVLQRLRYKDGQVTTAARNHNLLADWPRNNAWLLEDITDRLAGRMAWVPAHQVVRRKAFLKERFGIDVDLPDEKFIGPCIPRLYLHKVLPELRPGDVVLVITGDDRQQYCREMGVLLEEPADTHRPLRLVQSRAPAVEKTILLKTVWERKEILGFKFLRLRADAVGAAAAQAESMRTRVTVP